MLRIDIVDKLFTIHTIQYMTYTNNLCVMCVWELSSIDYEELIHEIYFVTGLSKLSEKVITKVLDVKWK